MTKQHKLPTRAEGIERIRTLYAVLAGIPSDKNRLYTYVHATMEVCSPPDARSMSKACGATACALGWAALYPEFIEMGLRMGHDDTPEFAGQEFSDAGMLFFALTEPESLVLFGPRSATGVMGTAAITLHTLLYRGLPKNRKQVSDKRIALHRIRRFLELTDAITPERSAELAEIEKGY